METPLKMSLGEMVNKVDFPEFLMIAGMGAVAALAGFIGLSYLTSSPAISSALGLAAGLFVGWRMLAMTASLPAARPAEAPASQHPPMSAAERRRDFGVVVLMGLMVGGAVSTVLALTVGEEQYRSSGAAELERIVARFPGAEAQATARLVAEGGRSCFEMGYRDAGMGAIYGALVPGPGLVQDLGEARMKHCFDQQIRAWAKPSPSGS
jgi:hypothetical protein